MSNDSDNDNVLWPESSDDEDQEKDNEKNLSDLPNRTLPSNTTTFSTKKSSPNTTHQERPAENSKTATFGTKESNMSAGFGAPMKTSSEQQPAFALDCEFIQVLNAEKNVQKIVVSIGIVDDRQEKILYSRIRKPEGSTVIDDSFVRTRGGLNPDWSKGISITVAQELLRDFTGNGGILIGWQLEGDLGALGFVEAQKLAQDNADRSLGERTNLPLGAEDGSTATASIVELTDIYRTNNGNKCQLSEGKIYYFFSNTIFVFNTISLSFSCTNDSNSIIHPSFL